MSNISHIIRKFNRFELKYLVPIREAENFKHDLLAYLKPDEHGDSCGSYRLTSLYYDSPDYRFYWEKIDGIKFRRKLRIRLYQSSAPLTGTTPVFVEIKQRLDKVTQKRRVLLPYQDALRFCSQREIPAHETKDAAVMDEIAGMLWQYDLQPASLVCYSRQALTGSDYDAGLRVTFDRDLSFNPAPFQLDYSSGGLSLFPDGWSVVEIKVNERIPYWLTELVAFHNLNMVRLSKYCRSIELLQDLPLVPSIPMQV